MRHEQVVVPRALPRNTSCPSTSCKIIPANFVVRSSFSLSPETSDESNQRRPLVTADSGFFHRFNRTRVGGISAFLRSLVSFISFPSIMLPSCKWLTIPKAHLSAGPSLGRKVTGTLFGRRRGHVSFAVQEDPRSEPVLVIEFAVSTSALVKEMSSGLVRIALECEKGGPPSRGGGRSTAAVRLFGEPVWTMYCNGRKCGHALSRACTESDWRMLSTVRSVSVGAGVIPAVDEGRKGGACDGELLYMRARFERVVGSRDSEAFYMLNPDGNGGPELSIFLLRI